MRFWTILIDRLQMKIDNAMYLDTSPQNVVKAILMTVTRDSFQEKLTSMYTYISVIHMCVSNGSKHV